MAANRLLIACLATALYVSLTITARAQTSSVLSPLTQAYIKAYASHDTAAAEAILAKMSPYEKGGAAYIRHDYPLAIKLFTPLAEQGDVKAQGEIGSLYSFGMNGVKQDYVQAAKYFAMAAHQGDSYGEGELGSLYAEGKGVPKDVVKAYMWRSLAAAQRAQILEKAGRRHPPRPVPETYGLNITDTQIAQAKRLAATCLATHYKECD